MKVGNLVKWRVGENHRYQLGVVTEVRTHDAFVWFFEDYGYSIMSLDGLEVA
jgi:hypothetical protein